MKLSSLRKPAAVMILSLGFALMAEAPVARADDNMNFDNGALHGSYAHLGIAVLNGERVSDVSMFQMDGHGLCSSPSTLLYAESQPPFL